MTSPRPSDPGSWIQSLIADYVGRSPENHFRSRSREPAFDAPLVGFANGADGLFGQYKVHVGPFHWTPLELFQLQFPRQTARAEDLTVISWILPQTRATRRDNRRERHIPAERWARARTYGEEFNAKLRRHVAQTLTERQIPAVAPMLMPQWERRTSQQHGYASTWSERHAAYACGLGTFGLSDGLITPRGKAMRLGSVVARVQIPPTPRPYDDHHAYCLFYTRGVCGRCMARCPAGAITPAGHDKVACKAYIRQTAMPYIQRAYGFAGRGCGLCQTKVPCEAQIPRARDLRGEPE